MSPVKSSSLFRRRSALRALAWAGLAAFFLVASIVPLGVWLIEGLQRVDLSMLRDPKVWVLLGRTLALSFGAAGVAMLLGTSAGIVLGTKSWPGKPFLRALLVLPLAVPPYLHAVGWTTLFQPRGAPASWISHLFSMSPSAIYDWIYSFPSGAVVLGFAYFPIPMLFTERALSLSSPTLDEAARVFGATRLRAFAIARWPSLAPAVASSMMVVFLLASSELGVPTLLKLPVLNVEIFTQLGAFNDVSTATLLSVPLLLTGIALVSLERIALTGFYRGESHEIEPPHWVTGRAAWTRRLFLVVLLVATFGLPLSAIVLHGADTEALAKMARIATRPAAATFYYAGMAAIIGTLLAFLLATLSKDSPPWISRGVDLAILLGFALPGSILALALLNLYGAPPLSRLITPAALVIAALVVRYFIVTYRIAGAAIMQFPAVLLEAAALDGAGPIQKMVLVVLPTVRVSLLAAVTVAFIFAAGEIGSTILLHAPGGETLPIVLYAIEANSPRSYMAAITLIQLLCLLAPLILAAYIVNNLRKAV